jgi:hypothetical protein
MRESRILNDNAELWDWLLENGNLHGHGQDFIENNVCVYKFANKGFVYYSWEDERTMQIHSALNGHLLRSEWVEVGHIAYFLGAERVMISGLAPDVAKRIGKHFEFYDEDGNLFLDLKRSLFYGASS